MINRQLTPKSIVSTLYISLKVYAKFRNFISTGATSGAGTAYPSGAPEFTPGF